MDAGQLQRHALGDHPLLAAGMDKQQVFLTILEKPEIATRIALLGRYLEAAGRRGTVRHGSGDKGLNPVQRIGGNALALTEPGDQLAVIDRAAAERRFRHPGLPAELGYLAEKLVVFHRTESGQQPRRSGWYHHLPSNETFQVRA